MIRPFSLCTLILRALDSNGPSTALEIANAIHRPVKVVRPKLTTLRYMGLAVVAKTRSTGGGPAHIWALSPAAHTALDAMQDRHAVA